MKTTREVANQPVLKGSVVIFAPTIVVAEFKNTGNIAAHDISTTIYFDDITEDSVEFTLPILSPGEDHKFGLPVGDCSKIIGHQKALLKMDEVESIFDTKDSSGILTFEFCFDSPFDEHYCYSTSIDVRDWLDNSSYMVRYTEEEKMRQALEDIGSNLDDIKGKI